MKDDNMKQKLLASVLLVIGLACLLLHSCGITAHAADNVLLSLQETYALYGHDFMVSYYNPDRDYTVNIQAEFIGTTFETVPSSHWDNIYFTGYGNMRDEYHTQLVKMPGLVYAIYNLDGQFVSYNGSGHFNIVKNFPIQISNITRFQQNIFWSGWCDAGSTYAPPYSNVLYNTSFNGVYNIAPVNNGAWQSYNRQYGYCIMPTYKMTSGSTLDESRTAYMYCCSADITAPTNGDNFSIAGQTLRLNGVDALDVFNRRDFTNPSSDEVWDWPILSDAYADVVLLVITCPILTGYEPPPTTTAPNVPGTQQPATYTDVTVDLSGLESGVAEIVRQQRLQLNLMEPMYVNGVNQVNQLNTIIGQLDAIYNRMLQNGEVPVNLVNAPTIQRNTAIQTYINNHLGTYTVAEVPSAELSQGISFISTVILEFTSTYSWVFTLGAFSLACMVAGWVIFRGKGS